jgi:peptidoglycan/LPS O-acetylase OafA/YrhL
MKYRFEALDGVRGGAILMVLLYHALGASYGHYHLPWNGLVRGFDAPWSFLILSPCTLGYLGVSVFFVVSGFCIHLSFEKGCGRSLRVFAAKRFFRIYPPYLFALMLFSAFWFGHRVFPPTTGQDAFQFFTHLLLIFNFKGTLFNGINPSFWSIAVEAQLYLCYALMIPFVRRIGWGRSLTIMAVAEVGMRLASGLIETKYDLVHSPRILSGQPFFFIWSWFIGAYLAHVFMRGEIGNTWLDRIPVVPVVLATFVCDFVRPLMPMAFFLAALATALMLTRWLRAGSYSFERSFAWRGLSFLGLVSYSLYLVHQPVQREIVRLLGLEPLPSFLLLMALVPVFAAASWGLWAWLEQPSIAVGNAVARHWKARLGEAGAAS